MAKTKSKAEDLQVGAFVSDVPNVTRKSDGGEWAKRLEFLSEAPGQWAVVHKTGDKVPHPTVNTLRQGRAAGVDPDDYEFVGRTIEGEGHVFARLLTDEQKAERDAKAAEKAEKADAE